MKIWMIGLFFVISSSQAVADALPVSKIADGVYVHTGKHNDFDEHYDGDIANIGFIVGTQSVAVIDTGGSFRIGSALRDAVKLVTNLPISYVINTHIHPDHIFGNAAFEQDNPEFIGHVNLPNTMEINRDSLLRALQQELGDAATGSKVVTPTQVVKESKDIDLGGRTIHLQAWPKAHTNTDLTVFDSKTKVLWTGDLLFISRAPSLDGDLKGWVGIVGKLKNIDAKLTVPGHGTPTEAKNDMLDKEYAYLNLLLSDIRVAIKSGTSLMDAINTSGQSGQSDWLLFDVVNRRNVNQAYPQLEWE